jgi:hypothetical protein
MQFSAHRNYNLLNVYWKWKRNVLYINTKVVRNGLAVRIIPANHSDLHVGHSTVGARPCVYELTRDGTLRARQGDGTVWISRKVVQ